MSGPPAPAPLSGEDLRLAARVCGEALRPLLDRDWSALAAELEMSCENTLAHVVSALGGYGARLAVRSPGPLPFRLSAVPREGEIGPRTLLDAMEAMAAVLALVVRGSPPEARAYHVCGMADPAGFVAMGCDEMLVHADDIARGLGGPELRPPEDLCRCVVRRLFPWARVDAGAWPTLRWANGRQTLPGRPRLGPDWYWHAAPVEEWDGQRPPGVA